MDTAQKGKNWRKIFEMEKMLREFNQFIHFFDSSAESLFSENLMAHPQSNSVFNR